MGYQRVSKPSSGNSQIHKKESPSSVPAMPVQAKSDSALAQDQEMPNYIPLAANWATNNNLMRSLSGTQEIQRQEELGKEEMEPIQAKLTIGQVGDKYEQEADQTAQRVVSQINSPQGQALQREEKPEEEELQKKPMVQRKSAGGGMDVTPNLEESIQQAKGGGQPLADNIRKPMEQAFGADFSSVNIHTDAQSDQLNQSIQAKAFTTGQDIFFRQEAYDPGSQGGQELIAHELTHVVQQSGGAVQRSPLPQPKGLMPMQKSPQGTIQRNVGFEFEVGSYPVTKMMRNMLPAEAAGTNVIPNAAQDDNLLAKADVLARNTGFELQIDEGVQDKHLEFVTNPPGFAENKAGRAALKKAMEDIEALGHEVEQKVAASNTKMNDGMADQQVIQTGEITGGVPTRPETLIRGGGQMRAEPQTTAGIRFDQIPSLIANMAKQPGETPNVTEARGVQRTVMAQKSVESDTAAMRTAVSDVRTTIGTFKTQMQAAGVVLPANFGSEKLV